MGWASAGRTLPRGGGGRRHRDGHRLHGLGPRRQGRPRPRCGRRPGSASPAATRRMRCWRSASPLTPRSGTSRSAGARSPTPSPPRRTGRPPTSPWPASDEVLPINTATNKPGRAIKVGVFPDAIAITPNGRTVYFGNQGNDTVTPISPSPASRPGPSRSTSPRASSGSRRTAGPFTSATGSSSIGPRALPTTRWSPSAPPPARRAGPSWSRPTISAGWQRGCLRVQPRRQDRLRRRGRHRRGGPDPRRQRHPRPAHPSRGRSRARRHHAQREDRLRGRPRL